MAARPAPDDAKARAFLSYTHVDDEFHGGAISRLRRKLEEAVRIVSGRPFQIFQDQDGIEWGRQWQPRLDEALQQATFLIPILTASYFESEGCRDELEKFLALEKQAGHDDLILPIHFLDIWQLDDPERMRDDSLLAEIRRRQWRDWRQHADVDPDDPKLRPLLRGLATEIQGALRLRLGPIPARAMPPAEPARPTQRIFRDADLAPEMVVLPTGSFLMGSPEDEKDRYDDEGPRHGVRIGHRLALGRHPVTFEEYGRYCAAKGLELPADEGWGRGRRPVINVSWDDARAYCGWLGEVTGKPYRLPSEAEWEYACRAGTTSRYWWGDAITPEQANYHGSGRGRTTEVGAYPANPWGLHDMHGNVWEWVEDAWHDSYAGAPGDGSAWIEGGAQPRRVLRGGSWGIYPGDLRAANRFRIAPGGRLNYAGFRVARTFTP